MGVPTSARIAEPNGNVTVPWAGFFARLDAALGGGGGVGGGDAAMFAAGADLSERAVDAALAEIVSFMPPTPAPLNFTAKSVVYAGATGAPTGNTSHLAWDYTNLRLGVNIASPGAPLEVRGTPVDIGYMLTIRPSGTGSSFFQAICNGAANAAGFAYTNLSLSGEWRMFMLGNSNNALRFAWNSTGLLWFQQELNITLGDDKREPTTGTYCFAIKNGTAPTALAADSVAIYANDVSASSELHAMNEAGDVTRLTGNMQLPSGRLLRFGGVTSTEVALKRASTVLEVRLADDSAAAALRALALRITDGAFLVRAEAALTNGAGAGAGTLTNAPTAGDPTKWIPIDDNGTTRFVPAW